MTESMSIEVVLDAAEHALDEGRSLRGTGFWKAVGACRRDRALAGMHADRIGRIDMRAFESGVKLRMPVRLGMLILLAMTLMGQAFILAALRAGAPPTESDFIEPTSELFTLPGFVPIAFFAGFVLMLLGTHSLTHWLIGRVLGIRFTYVFLGGPPPPRPGVKSDYESYLKTRPQSRALMHASGAVVTKALPFLLLPPALRLFDGWPYITLLLIIVGIGQIITDVLLSTKVSDWMKVRREADAAKTWIAS